MGWDGRGTPCHCECDADGQSMYAIEVPSGVRGCSSMVEPQSSKLATRVRFPSSTPDSKRRNHLFLWGLRFLFLADGESVHSRLIRPRHHSASIPFRCSTAPRSIAARAAKLCSGLTSQVINDHIGSCRIMASAAAFDSAWMMKLMN